MLTDDLNGRGDEIDVAARWLDERLPDFEKAPPVELGAVFAERWETGPQHGMTLGSAVVRLIVLHELRKVGALTYDEFRGLKTRLLAL